MTSKAVPSFEDSTQDVLARAHDWILHLESDTATQQDRIDFERWLSEDPRHAELYDQALTFRDALQRVRIADLDADITARSRAEKVTGFLDELREGLTMPRLGAGVALTAALVWAVFWLPSPGQKQGAPPAAAPSAAIVSEYSTTVAEVRTISLSDSTVVTLGAASSLSAVFSEAQRIVHLTAGEAHFDVAPDASRPFAVKADSLSATVLGTVFDVRRIAEGYKVAVSEGVVQVSAPLIIDGKPSSIVQRQTLTAGELVGVLSNGRMRAPERIAMDAVGAWRSHQLIYKGDKLSDVLSDANRYSETPIEIAPGSEAIGDLQVRGVFLGTDIGRLLETIEQILPVQADHSQDGKILVRMKG
ncbi:MAG: FecR domain-containing protein [Pseudomonadota bacterium]